jgi:hypothetical protein
VTEIPLENRLRLVRLDPRRLRLALSVNLLDEGSEGVSHFRVRHQSRAFDNHPLITRP